MCVCVCLHLSAAAVFSIVCQSKNKNLEKKYNCNHVIRRQAAASHAPGHRPLTDAYVKLGRGSSLVGGLDIWPEISSFRSNGSRGIHSQGRSASESETGEGFTPALVFLLQQLRFLGRRIFKIQESGFRGPVSDQGAEIPLLPLAPERNRFWAQLWFFVGEPRGSDRILFFALHPLRLSWVNATRLMAGLTEPEVKNLFSRHGVIS